MTRVDRVPSATVSFVAWDHPDAVALRDAMAAEVGPRYADRAAGLARTAANAVDVDTVMRTVLIHRDGEAVGHAVLRWNGPDLELKRMFVRADSRGTGVSTLLLATVEDVARDAGVRRLILQTGDRQPDAVALYEKSGYVRVPIFPPYEAVTFSRCYEKQLEPSATRAATTPTR